jgi:two-component system, NarL family, response regulator DevR
MVSTVNHAVQLEPRPMPGRAIDPPRAARRPEAGVLTVYLVDPHEVVQLGFRALLAPVADLQLVGTSADQADARRAVAEGWADVVVIDADLDGDGGRQLGQQLASIEARARYCFLVGGSGPAAAELPRLGARGLLHRRAAGRHLVDAIRRCATDDLAMDPTMAGQLVARLLEPRAAPVTGRLSERDLELLRLLGEGRTNREIAEAVYLSEKTVKNYLSRLFRKLGVRSRTEAALLSARYHGPDRIADVGPAGDHPR